MVGRIQRSVLELLTHEWQDIHDVARIVYDTREPTTSHMVSIRRVVRRLKDDGKLITEQRFTDGRHYEQRRRSFDRWEKIGNDLTECSKKRDSDRCEWCDAGLSVTELWIEFAYQERRHLKMHVTSGWSTERLRYRSVPDRTSLTTFIRLPLTPEEEAEEKANLDRLFSGLTAGPRGEDDE